MGIVYQRNFDLIILGSNYFSYLYGLRALALGQSVCIVDDERFQYGYSYRGQLDYLQKSYLQDWGRDRLIPELIEIDRNLTSYNYTLEFSYDKDYRCILLGRSPAQNLNEILRKLWDFFDAKTLSLLQSLNLRFADEQFSQIYFQKVAALSRNLYYFKNNHNLALEELEEALPQELASLVVHWDQALKNEDEQSQLWVQKLRSFVFLLAQHFQFKFNREMPQFELIILILRMLSPTFRLDLEKFESSLKHEFLVWNGSFKRSPIKKIEIVDEVIESLEIDSFEGIIHPRRVMILSESIDFSLPIGLRPEYLETSNLYCTIRVDLSRFKSFFGRHLQRYGLYYSDRMAKHQALYLSYDLGEEPHMTFYIKSNLAQKPVHFLSQAQSLLLEFAGRNFQSFLASDLVLSGDELSWGRQVSLLDNHASSGRYPKVRAAKLPLFKNKVYLNSSNQLNRAEYLGPANCGPFGPLTSLIELKNCGNLRLPEKNSSLEFGPTLN